MLDSKQDNKQQENIRYLKIRVPNPFNLGRMIEVQITVTLALLTITAMLYIFLGEYIDKNNIFTINDLILSLQASISIGRFMAILGFITFILVYMNVFLSYKNVTKEKDFVDVDDEASEAKSFEMIKEMEDLKAEIFMLKQNIKVVENKEGLMSLTTSEADSFSRYIWDLKNSIEERIRNLDKKASLMLDKGTSYARYGIGFYLSSIVIWQWWISNRADGISREHIVGMVSCTILFLFVEFLSAWFMKQYQHFIDTSTYLTKIKSIFDKYMLSYLALKGLSKGGQIQNEHVTKILDTVSQEIKWPDTNLIYNKRDISFAKEAIESISSVYKELANLKIGNIKSEVKKEDAL